MKDLRSRITYKTKVQSSLLCFEQPPFQGSSPTDFLEMKNNKYSMHILVVGELFGYISQSYYNYSTSKHLHDSIENFDQCLFIQLSNMPKHIDTILVFHIEQAKPICRAALFTEDIWSMQKVLQLAFLFKIANHRRIT